MKPLYRNSPYRAFTLVELLVILVIIGILIALLLPAVQQARQAANRMQCSNNLKQIGLALHSYHDVLGALPPLEVINSDLSPVTNLPTGWWSWYVRILPYVEQAPLSHQIDMHDDSVAKGPFYKDQTSQNIRVFLCPSDPHSKKTWDAGYSWLPGWLPGKVEMAHTNYLGVRGSTRDVPGNGVFPASNISVRMPEITDGLSQTIWVGERPGDEAGEWGWWALGGGYDGHGLADHVLDCSDGLRKGVHGSSDDLTHFWSNHPYGAQFVFGDGSVKFLSYTINQSTFQALGSRNGGEPVDEF